MVEYVLKGHMPGFTFSKVSSLDHEVLYNSMKRGSFVAQLFPCGFASSLFPCKQKKNHDGALIVFYTKNNNRSATIKKVPLRYTRRLEASGSLNKLRS